MDSTVPCGDHGQADFVVSAIVNGKRAISLDIATELSSAFGTSVDYWMNLEKSYQQFLGSHSNDSISRRARLFQLAPVKEMMKRNWIKPSKDWTEIEQQICRFLEICLSTAHQKRSRTRPRNPARMSRDSSSSCMAT